MGNRSVHVEYYRSKAEEVRLIAESLKDAEARRILLDVAGDYLMLAENLARMGDPVPAGEL